MYVQILDMITHIAYHSSLTRLSISKFLGNIKWKKSEIDKNSFYFQSQVNNIVSLFHLVLNPNHVCKQTFNCAIQSLYHFSKFSPFHIHHFIPQQLLSIIQKKLTNLISQNQIHQHKLPNTLFQYQNIITWQIELINDFNRNIVPHSLQQSCQHLSL